MSEIENAKTFEITIILRYVLNDDKKMDSVCLTSVGQTNLRKLEKLRR